MLFYSYMASNYHFHLPLFLIFSTLFSFPIPSVADEFRQWLTYNVQIHNSRQMMPTSKDGPTTAKNGLDVALKSAELSAMRLNIAQDGSGNFTSIAQAIGSIPPHNTRRVVLDIKPGVYREKIHILKTMPFVTLSGDPKNPPTITGNDTASVMGKDGRRLKTFQSATVAIDADYFVATNMKFENTAPHEVGIKGEQAVALRISGNKAAFYNCSFYGSQDTLYDHKGLHYFRGCFIQGSVDFIFGYGKSLYENCTLSSIAKKKASLTAQKRIDASMSSGFSFKGCTVTGSGMVYLGRAWGAYSRVVFSYTFMDTLVIPQGWNNWGDPKRNLSVYYGEYECSGPGANMSQRVPWAKALTDQEAKPFLGIYYVEGESWLIQ